MNIIERNNSIGAHDSLVYNKLYSGRPRGLLWSLPVKLQVRKVSKVYLSRNIFGRVM